MNKLINNYLYLKKIIFITIDFDNVFIIKHTLVAFNSYSLVTKCNYLIKVREHINKLHFQGGNI